MGQRSLLAAASIALPALSGCTPAPAPSQAPPESRGLAPVSSFAHIADPAARSVALFTEAARVITHARCTNCHPPDDRPRQGLDHREHLPVVSGGEKGHGIPGLPCNACHQAANTPIVGQTEKSIPGHPKWALAPIEMAWLGKPVGYICEQLKDPKRNGNRTLAEIHHHMAEDTLVGWGWSPGPGIEPVPGTQRAFGELIKAWIDSGAHCPGG